MSRTLAPFLLALFCCLPATAGEKTSAVPSWIWLGQGQPNQTVLFRKTIDLQDNIIAAKIYGSCDNQMIVFINGKEVLRSDAWEIPASADVTNLLKKGKNVIAVRGKNQDGAAGLLLQLEIEEASKRQQVLFTDSTWRVAEKGPKGWQSVAFNDSEWQAATVIGKLGDGPWKQINKATLTQVVKQKEAVPTYLDQLKAVKDFKVELLYSVPPQQGSWVSMTTDPKGRLIVSDQYGKLYRVTPPALGSKDEKSKVEAIPVEIGEAQGLLWAFDSLYVMVNKHIGKNPSGLYRVKDTDGDGELDKAELLRPLEGAGEHGPHAVILSPDGKSLYVCAGNHTNLTKVDTFLAPKIWGEDSLLPRMWDPNGHAVGRMAPGGSVYRVDPDGKKWDLFCIGFRNQYDIAFNRDGELFTYDSDMEWDMNTPWYQPTRVFHCVNGGDSGWRSATAKFPPYYIDTLPPVVEIGPGSPTGLVFGTGAKFPAKYQEALFMCDWSYGKLYAVHLTPTGSTYKGQAEEFIRGTPLPLTDIVINPTDGAMYFTVGGRKTKSGLYRVTYTGKESTDPIKGVSPGADQRALRKKLEAYHGQPNPKAIDAVWPYLGHEDRFIRWAARTGLENQDTNLWQQRALSERHPQAALTALLALTRKGEKSVQPKLLAALGHLEWKKLNHAQQLDLVRLYALTFIRMGQPESKLASQVIDRFDPLFPSGERELNAELCKILVYLEAPSAASKTMKLMSKALTQEEQMQYALLLRSLKTGWTMKDREEYFRWFLKAANYKGGNSFGGFVRNIKNDALTQLSDADKLALKPILDIKQIEPMQIKPRPFVKKWNVQDVIKLVEGAGLKNRDFNKGRTMFAAASCFACHRFANEGGSYGPDLTGLSGRFTKQDLVDSIVLPSKVISDQYQAVVVALSNGQIVQGRIVNLFGDSLSINTDMLNPNKLVSVNRKQIESITPSPVSMMPEGLLDTLNDEEVLDLMAYLLSGGDRNNAMFTKKE